jgi:hypothetical protein
MKIYTSYFANLRGLAKAGIQPVAIVRSPPKWYQGPNYQTLAPSYDNFRINDKNLFRTRFLVQLGGLDPKAILEDLQDLSNGQDIALLCYENVLGGDWCHRQVVAEWLHKSLGIKIEEFQAIGPDEDQLSLF